MNVLLLVVDSLRAASLGAGRGRPSTPFLDKLHEQSLRFRRAYATECWTLPTHCSMFTGLLPSQHGAHFQTMALAGPAPTVAELLAHQGHHTEVITRNFVFDGTIPGVTRGFQVNTPVLSRHGRLHPWALFLALSKPRFRRLVRSSGFFHPFQRQSRRFLSTFARTLMPADEPLLDYTLDRMAELRRRRRPYFLFCNLYDVHAPYPPSPRGILRPLRSPSALAENVLFPFAMQNLGAHEYLREGFRLPEASRRLLLSRYHAAIELMDGKLARFYAAAQRGGLLDDTLLVLTSDHGEGFGEHGLYLHDASAYETHLHVPLWVRHPERPAGSTDDVVSTRDLFGLMHAVGAGKSWRGTLLDATYRGAHPIALAEHFYYPHADWIAPRYRCNLRAAIAGERKVVVRGDRVERYDLARDAHEVFPEGGSLADFETDCRDLGLGSGELAAVVAHLRGAVAPPLVSAARPSERMPEVTPGELRAVAFAAEHTQVVQSHSRKGEAP